MADALRTERRTFPREGQTVADSVSAQDSVLPESWLTRERMEPTSMAASAPGGETSVATDSVAMTAEQQPR